jgi:hypothetical protein
MGFEEPVKHEERIIKQLVTAPEYVTQILYLVEQFYLQHDLDMGKALDALHDSATVAYFRAYHDGEAESWEGNDPLEGWDSPEARDEREEQIGEVIGDFGEEWEHA